MNHKQTPIAWKEIEIKLGDEIFQVAENLVQQAPAYCIFKSIRIESYPSDTTETIIERYQQDKIKRFKEGLNFISALRMLSGD